VRRQHTKNLNQVEFVVIVTNIGLVEHSNINVTTTLPGTAAAPISYVNPIENKDNRKERAVSGHAVICLLCSISRSALYLNAK